jgi:hypothetical protein
MTQMIIMEMVQHTNFLFRFVEALASSPLFIFVCGCGLTIVPFAGIMYIHKNNSSNGKSDD